MSTIRPALLTWVATTLLLAGALPARAAPFISTSPTQGPPGSSFSVTGGGFQPREPLRLLWDGGNIGGGKAAASGEVDLVGGVPTGAGSGPHTVELRGTRSGSATASFLVSAPPTTTIRQTPTTRAPIPAPSPTTLGPVTTPATGTADPTVTTVVGEEQGSATTAPVGSPVPTAARDRPIVRFSAVPTNPRAGTTVLFTGVVTARAGRVSIRLGDEPVAEITVDADGTFETRTTIPPDHPPGPTTATLVIDGRPAATVDLLVGEPVGFPLLLVV
ncbi:MAG TPA: hypothetical protein VE173_11255, partial [Longimicrobiales bacterium]|nr:hypothetical protein [Longimicrobiales bacterium]